MLNDKGEEVGIIYGWYNTNSGKWYIGQTIRPLERFKDHIDAAINKKDNTKFHNALRKYGLDKFVYCVLEENVLRVNLNLKEIEWIEYYDSYYSGYNLTTGGDAKRIISEEVKEKISIGNKGKIVPIESRIKMSHSKTGNKNGFYNKHHSLEWKQKIYEAHKGKPSPNRTKIIQYDLNGNFIRKYESLKMVRENGYKSTNIALCCKGKVKQANGFIWKYAS